MGLTEHNRRPSVIRICLDEDGRFHAFPWYGSADEGDYAEQPLDPKEAIRLITAEQIPLEVACKDPGDNRPHNYETLNPKAVTLSYI